jgi:prepilin-type N-terminal cleavage/methylation domain-containing protein
MNTRHTRRGFTLLEALVALAVVSIGLMGVVKMQGLMARYADVSKQRSEATRLAQQQIETLRSYTSIDTAPGQLSWNALAGGNDVTSTNADFTRTWTLAGASTDPLRRVSVNVAWNDRAGDPQNVTLNSVISRTDPSDVGLLGFPLPQNTTLKRPKNRNLNIPVPALDLGGGKSVYQLANNFAVVFSNDSGYVVMRCDFVVNTAAQLSACTEYSATILAGYVSLDGASFPSGMNLNTSGLTGSSGVTCTIGNAVNQNDNSTISGYKYYLCVVALPTNGSWSGMVRLTGMASGANLLVCRFQYAAQAGVSANARNVQPYSAVTESLDNQNYIISATANCPTIGGLATTLHQNCRSSNASRATDCPAT